MGKKICFLWVLAVALLISPIHAQTVAKRMKATAERFVADKPLVQEKMKAAKAAKAKAKGRFQKFEKIKSPLQATESTGEVVDSHGIITSPAEGEVLTFLRSGYSYYSANQQVALTGQSGTVTIVECSDGTIYIKDPLAMNPAETWVKGTKEGNTITIPAKQPLFYSIRLGTTASLRWGLKTEGGDYVVADDHADAFTFTINGNTISLEGTSGDGYFMGQFWDDDNRFSNYGDYETVWNKLVVPTHIDELPYVPSFLDLADQTSFTIINANNDDGSWRFTSGGYAQYSYNRYNAADDWLITPAIKLEAGKAYRFAIDTWASFCPERIEVKMGTDKTVEAMTKAVVDATDVTWKSDDVQTLENKLITVDEDGYYYFGLHAISDPDEYFLHVNNLVVEFSADLNGPDSVTNLTVVPTENKLEATIRFNAPTKTVNGADLTENLTKIEILRDGEVITTLEDVAPGAEISYVDADNALTIGSYVYQVVAYNASGKGLTSDGVTAHVSVVFEVPYVADFSQNGVFDKFQVIDANGDHSTWKWEDTAKFAYYEHNDNNAGDDYLVSLPIHFEAGRHYVVTANVNAFDSDFEECFEVVLGRAASASSLTMRLIEPTVLTSEFAADYENTFTVPVSGNYYVAIHAISDKAKYFLVAHSLSVTKGVEPTAPAAVSDFTATAGALGSLEVNLAFTAPTKAANGSELEDAMTIDVYRNDILVKTLENVAPGSSLSWKDDNVGNGKTYAYQVVASNVDGAGVKSDKVDVFVGIDVPAAVENVAAKDQNSHILFSWDAVGTTGPRGGYVDPAQVTYKAWTVGFETYMYWEVPVLEEMIGEVTGQTSLEAAYNTSEGEQGLEYFAIQPNSVTGAGEETYTSFLVGKPYSLPFMESFTGQKLHYYWSSDAALLVSQESADNDGVALEMLSEQRGAAFFESGKISIKNTANPTLIFNAKGSNIKVLTVYGAKDGGDSEVLQAVQLTGAYDTYKISLDNLKDAQNYVRFKFVARYMNPCTLDDDGNVIDKGDFVTIDAIRVVDLYEHDVEVIVNAPATVVAGDTAHVTVVVRNNADTEATGYSLKLTDDEHAIFDQAIDIPLKGFSSIGMDLELRTTVFDEATDVALKAEVFYSDDLNPVNNTDEAVITIVDPAVSIPTDLVAQQVGDSTVTLTWTTPASVAVAPVTESFEDGLAGFTTVDADADGNDWIHHVNVEGQGEKYMTKTGNGSVYSESYINYVGAVNPDNWLITPAAKLNGEFSFWACGQDEDYVAEHFAVYVSTTSATDPAAFTKVSDEFVATAEMKEYKVDLSAFAGQSGYVAIRHYHVTNLFCLVVDDVTYTPVDLVPVSYNVYVDTVEENTTTETTADIKNLSAGNHIFAVTAVFANGVESRPVKTSLEIVNAINEIVNSGKSFSIYTVDGKLINRQATSLDGLKGTYIVNKKKIILN